MAHSIYSKGTPIWYDDRELGWTRGEIIDAAVNGKDVQLTLSNERHGKAVVIRTNVGDIADNDVKLPPLRNSDDFDLVSDLTALPHLNEPSILQVIEARYAQKKIYTYSGIVLIAVNPFNEVPLYGADMIQAYAGRGRETLDPHLFTIAEETYTAMRHTRRSQTVIISGESGAGKTESAKYIMRYLASVTSASEGAESSDDSTTVERQILATNPILEAFGNAKTMRNDNSSRFGKYIQILFDASHTIVGARISTYLLERARISFQQRGERNYHIFYQLCAGASSKERSTLSLDRSASNFAYLASSAFDTDEARDFATTKRALSTVGIDEEKQMRIFEVLAGLLHLGNVDIRQYRDNPDAVIDEKDGSLVIAMRLLGINLKEFRKWTATKHFAARGEDIKSSRTAAQARGVRDGVAKFIYSCLFEWLVAQVNASLGTDDALQKEHLSIAVLDIYGFEHFETNSFEQFCINYANEKLQQQFTSHVFKIQQAEYASEDIDWQTIDFSDNQPTIDLIEGRLGLLAILDEESRLAAGTDTSFIEKLNWQLLGQGQGTAPKVAQGGLFRSTPDTFTIAHYAHDVEYTVDGFLEKNRGTVPDEHMDLVLGSSNAFLREVVEASAVGKAHQAQTPQSGASRPITPTAHGPAGPVDVRGHVRKLTNATPVAMPTKAVNTSRKPTQCSIFKTSLKTLMETLAQTDIHYIRCIKPNDTKRPWTMERSLVQNQLRACGVVETVRISCSGYPSRWTYEDFAKRYSVLLPANLLEVLKSQDAKGVSLLILKRFVQDSSRYRLGRTKVFFRLRVLAILEGLRLEKERLAAITIQCAWRCLLARVHLAWLREEKEEAMRLERERLEEEERLAREQADDKNQLSIIVTARDDLPEIPDSPSLPPTPRTPSSPKSTTSAARSSRAPPSPRVRHSRSFVRSPIPGLSAVPEFGYQQHTESSARRKVDILESDAVRHRGREDERGSAAARTGKSVERAKSREVSRGRGRMLPPPPTPEKDRERGRVSPAAGLGGLLIRPMSLSRDKAKATRGKEKEKETSMAKRMKMKFARRENARTPQPPPGGPSPPTPPKTPPKQQPPPGQTPIYNKFMTGRRQTPWYLTAEA